MNKHYIFTEIVNCGKIGKIALDSFHKYHNHTVYIYGTKDDFSWIKPNKNNIFIEVDEKILKGYEKAHLGTALLWEQIFNSTNPEYYIHFDSDVIFRENIIDQMIDLSKEYDIIGPRRNYHHNPNNNMVVRHLADLCQTNCSLWNRSKISKKYLSKRKLLSIPTKKEILSISVYQILKRTQRLFKKIFNPQKIKVSKFAEMIQGTYSNFSFPLMDFFDPVMFDMISNGARIFYLNENEVGGCDMYGKRDNEFKDINNFPTKYKLDFGSKLVHFSCVGSGMNFYTHPERQKNIPSSYVKASLDRYALFCKIFYNESIGDINMTQYQPIINIPKWY